MMAAVDRAGDALAARSTAPEAMDADDLDPAIYAAVLADLARVNTVTLARAPTLDFLDRVAARHPGRLRILDVGFGDGDMLRAIARWAGKRGVAVDLVGIDLNPNSAPTAARHVSATAIDYRTGDYATLAEERWDVILSSLVAHHMSHVQIVAFVRFMQVNAAKAWLINDLWRHRFAWHGYPLLARLMRWHPIVRHDGQLSIARSYRPDEWPPILAEADASNARVYTRFPFRLCVECLR